MKKLIVLILVIILSNCEIKIKEVKAAESIYDNNYSYYEEIHNGMKFALWYKTYNDFKTGYAIAVVNLTKDSLEVALLRKQLNFK